MDMHRTRAALYRALQPSLGSVTGCLVITSKYSSGALFYILCLSFQLLNGYLPGALITLFALCARSCCHLAYVTYV